MAVNLCSQVFGTSVITGSVSADGYEVENLLGRMTMWGQPKGFVAERFIKPPVDVTFMFPFNVWIQKILIDPKVGSQMSSVVEVFTASVVMPPCPQDNSRTLQKGESKNSDCNQKPNLKSQSQMQSEKDTAVFSSVGRAFSVDGNTSLFCFNNHSYQPIYLQMSSDDPPPEELRTGVVTRSLRYTGALTNVSHVTVRINRVISGSVAIRSVQIWGQPSRSCSKPIVNWVLHVAKAIRNPQEKEQKIKTAEQTGKISKQNAGNRMKAFPGCKTAESRKSSADLQGCPEEFIDPITNDMLMLPILLPSGHTIDSETMQKHSEAEALWGRPPNDPFTGIPFSKGCQPLPNVKLKESLDRYLLQGGGNVAAPSARDVGRSSSTSAGVAVPAPASLVSSKSQQSASCSHKSLKQLDQTNLIVTGNVRSGRAAKRKFTEDQKLSSKRTNLPSMQKDVEMPVSYTSQPSQHSSSTLSSPSAAKASTYSHEEVLAQSLDSALESALSSLPSFRKRPSQQSSNLEDNTTHSWFCSACNKTLATKDGFHVVGPLNMYKLPCSHLICRDCLSSPRDQRLRGRCTVCGKSFERAAVVKVHV